MKNYTLTDNLGRTLEFSHDPVARKLSGPHSDTVKLLVDYWDGNGCIYGTQYAPAPDPLGSARDMAIMLASSAWVLPSELAELLPPKLPLPDGAVA